MDPTLSSTPRVEVLTSPERRRRWSIEEKICLVEESNRPGMSASYVARNHGIAPPTVCPEDVEWLREARGAIRADDEVFGAVELRKFKRQVES
jgi:transposase